MTTQYYRLCDILHNKRFICARKEHHDQCDMTNREESIWKNTYLF